MDLATKLGEFAQVRRDSDAKSTIMIREVLNRDHGKPDPGGRPGHLRIVLELLEQAGIPLLGIRSRETSLATLFLSLTGRTLRD